MTTSTLLDSATFAGAHALAIYGALLLLVTLTAGIAARALLPARGPGAPAPEPLSPIALCLRFAVGFGCIVGGAWLFTEIAEALHTEHTLGRWDEAFILAMIDHIPDAAIHAFYLVTFLGNRETLVTLGIVVFIGLLLIRRRGLALGWALGMLGNAVLNPTLKHVFERARPLHPTEWLTEGGFSFPSGHSSGIVVTMGLLAYLAVRLLPRAWHVPAWMLAAGLAFTVGASRIFLRVHFPSDVIAGFATGGAWLTVSLVSISLARWARRRRRGGQPSGVELTR